MTAGTFFAKFAGKIVKIIGLALLILSFVMPLASKKVSSGRGNSESSSEKNLISFMCFNKLDKDTSKMSDSEKKDFEEYKQAADFLFPNESKKAPVSIVDLIGIILVSVAALCSLLLDVIPGLRKAKLFDKLVKFGYWIMLLLGISAVATMFEVVVFGSLAGVYSYYAIVGLLGLIFLMAGENFEKLVGAVKTLVAADKKAVSTYVTFLSTPIVFVVALIGAGLVGGWFFAARFFIIPGAVAGCLFAFIASEALKKVSNK